MGDKNGKKDKAKEQKQNAAQHAKAEQQKQANRPQPRKP